MPLRLFERSEAAHIADTSDKIAFGKAGVAAKNISFANFLRWLEDTLGFFKVANNLSEANPSAVRGNIDLFSTTEVNNLVSPKANSADVLEKGNTTEFIPAVAFDPATKKSSEAVVTTSVRLTVTPSTSGEVQSVNLICYRVGNIQMLTGNIVISGVTGTEVKVGTISGYKAPGNSDVEFPMAVAKVHTNENAAGRITSNGNIYGRFHNDGTWRLNVISIGS